MLVSLHQEIDAFNINQPNGVFDVADSERAKLYFYMMRSLIRQNTSESLDNLNFLLNIPSVRALAHTEVTPAKSNELLRLAMSFNNRGAAQSLLNSVIERLMERDPDEVLNMIRANGFQAFCTAAESGHLELMERLMERAPDEILNMIRANDFEAFWNAAHYGHLEVMNRLMELAPDEVPNMIRANDFRAFRSAAWNGYLEVMEQLMERAPDEVLNMIRANDFDALWGADWGEHYLVVNRLMLFPDVFAHAEMHTQEYGVHVESFVSRMLVNLRQEIDAFNISQPNGVFDVTDSEQAKLYFYMMRNLIRQNTSESLDNLNFLLNIPSVRALAHTEVTLGESNELLLLAMSLNNIGASQALFNIHAVRVLAQAHNFYRDEQRNGLDLRAVSEDRESSMRALTQGEQKRLERATEKYQPEIKQLGVSVIMSELKNLLMQRYQDHPAIIRTGDGRDIPLALEFSEFKKLAQTLSADTGEKALKSYYQHPEHTAYRYLSKPNRWLNADARHVNRGADGSWSTFEEYEALIALMYLAAKDERTPAIDGYTIETRVENFIKALALIGRAHNWDGQRFNSVTQKYEEYDDLEGDKPSCYSGVKRRLFQSVQGHPLLAVPTIQILYQEVCSVIRSHFISHITHENCSALQRAWQQIVESGQSDNTAILQELNLTEEEQAQYAASIQQKIERKYDSQLDEELKEYLVKVLQVHQPFKSLAEKFGGNTELSAILKEKQAELGSSKPSSEDLRNLRCKFFKPQEPQKSTQQRQGNLKDPSK
jgi:hypothetical protein